MLRRLGMLTMALAIGALTLLGAVGPVIGLAVSQGSLELDRVPVQGNANVMEGSWVVTSQSPARLQVGEAKVTLGTGTRAQVFRDRLVIERGSALLSEGAAYRGAAYRGAAYRLDAGELSVRGADAAAQAIVERASPAVVQIAALKGAVHVSGRDGVALAVVEPGSALRFEADAGDAAASEMRGVLRKEKDKYWLKDPVTNLEVEIRAAGLEKFVNECVYVQGPSQASPDHKTQVINAVKVERNASGCQAPPKVAAQGGSQAAKTARVLSHGQKVGIGAAVVAGAGLGVGIPLAVLSR